jgi:hypothetical protein
MIPSDGTIAKKMGMAVGGDVVEIGLLLPASWADALLEMSKRRGQSIAQILRGMIDRALVDDLSADH